jgi:pantoate--beta-alanine ligase
MRRMKADRPVVFVPTMGALHDGHLALIRAARGRGGNGGTVVVSIFVNPIQFGPTEDVARYPRPLRNDLALCRASGVDVVFLPETDAMYAPDRSVRVDESELSSVLCGASRPGHFAGVCTVVTKLFHLVNPDEAIFGEKDWQQVAVIRRMVRDLDFPVRVVTHPTVRESDGLAMSSRNAYLTETERLIAPEIYRAMKRAVREASPVRVEEAFRGVLARFPTMKVDYASVVDAEALGPVRDFAHPARLMVAVFLGRARLIDNIPIPCGG